MNRRDFTIAAMASLLAGAARAEDGTYEKLLGALDLDVAGNEVQVQSGATHAALRLGKCAFLFAPKTKVTFDVESGFTVKMANLIQGAMHAVFDPAAPAERSVMTKHATIGIRGTAHYVELEEDEDRTYSCCCYGHIHIDGGAQSETQKTNYHDARIINRAGQVLVSPYHVPFNHYDNSLVFLEGQVGRQPRWSLPNGQMQFISPFSLSDS